MTPKERFFAAILHKQTDRVPIYIAGLSSRVASLVLGREAYVGGGIQQWREARALWEGGDSHAEFLERSRQDTLRLCEILDLDLVRPSYWRLNVKPDEKIDDYTFLYGDLSGDYIVRRFDPATELYQVVEQHPPATDDMTTIVSQVENAERECENYQASDSLFPELDAACKYFGSRRAVPGYGVGLSIPYQSQAWLRAIVERPDLIARWLDARAEIAARNAESLARRGFTFLMGGGDFACNKGPFYSPRAFHDLMLPRLQKVSEACHQSGALHAFASDGNLWPVADDLFGASGIDAFYEIDRLGGMDLRTLRQTYPDLALLGNISSNTLHRGTKEDVIRETMDCLEVAKERGSIIVGPSNQVVAQTPIENFEAMMETLHQYR